ncbi:GNAT family N-acetyltransferase [Kribbella sp. CA-293567]|uniref:GNAT family N-acetyltransferase n=1 Tax=Kribbella sp. CA-293567 TaxID=3002436 RepID=UPI0022DCE678|nr:GNAT family N-acetyltransferase [Kribbella sp. CA-293567]WBQ05689.1 GNAT family N-acetyltransferase [Kribbella sp. CA-293567]
MTDDEFTVWRAHSVEDYAGAIGPARGLDPATALETASQEFEQLLPAGRRTENQWVWLAQHEDEPVGTLWISTHRPIPFVYLLEVLPEQRGKGYGRSIMLAGEDECRSRGYEHLALNVFGDNAAAISLYDSLGYVVVTQEMRKAL